MRCDHCGTENVDGARFCKGCGADLTQQNEAANQPAWGSNMNNTKTAPNQNYSNITPSQVGDMGDYQPISMWGYFGYELLFAIPCVGFVLLLVCALVFLLYHCSVCLNAVSFLQQRYGRNDGQNVLLRNKADYAFKNK